eukprot:5129428-Prymnesium_polylepis.1
MPRRPRVSTRGGGHCSRRWRRARHRRPLARNGGRLARNGGRLARNGGRAGARRASPRSASHERAAATRTAVAVAARAEG